MNFLVAQLLIVLAVGVFWGCLVWVGFVGVFSPLPETFILWGILSWRKTRCWHFSNGLGNHVFR